VSHATDRTRPEPASPGDPSAVRGTGGVNSRARLVALSFLMLFVELALIRWTGSNVIYLSYFSNFVLLGSFLGIGVGFLRSGSKVELFPRAAPVLTVFIFFVLLFPVQVDRSGTQLIYFGGRPSGLPIWVMLPVIFVATAASMAMIADGVARTFATFQPLEAYRLDIVGSLLGIGAFSLLSFVDAPPVAWGLVVAVCFVVLSLRRTTLVQWLQLGVALLVIVVMLWSESASPNTYWSPYYKVWFGKNGDVTYVFVNGISHQSIKSVADRRRTEPLYFASYVRAPTNSLGRVLIIGAGTGSDVAIALSEGAKRVDAVEIDPRLYALGRELNPDHPYQDPRVHVFINDGRAFLQQSDQRYDMILFALPDSLTLVAGQSSLRLESYLFTVDAMRMARDHLAPGGVFAMYNFYREQWLVDRLAGTLDEAYGHPPCIDTTGTVGHFAVLTTSVDPQQVSCRTVWHPAERNVPPPATDDHPFVYLRTRTVPSIYLVTLGLILFVSILTIRLSVGRLRGMRPYLDLFFMGAAFLLLETKNVVQFALLFGTTWFVNALVFGGLLLSVLTAIEVARRFRFANPGRLYAALVAVLLVAWVVSPESLLSLSVVPRFCAAVSIAFGPIFVANLIFAERFRDVGSSVIAFGANLLGAMVGGLLEYGALVVGYRALLLVVAGLYVLAFVSRPGESGSAGNGEARSARSLLRPRLMTRAPERHVVSGSVWTPRAEPRR
jgi:SAM-dependent methyltransferase